MAQRGRPTKLTSELQDKILKWIRMGASYEDACRVCRISETTFRSWKAIGEKAKSGIQYDFLMALKEAESTAKIMHVQNLNQLAVGGKQYTETKVVDKPDGSTEITTITKTLLPDASTSKWILGRRWPEEWGSKKAVEISTEGGKPLPIQILHDDVDTDDL